MINPILKYSSSSVNAYPIPSDTLQPVPSHSFHQSTFFFTNFLFFKNWTVNSKFLRHHCVKKLTLLITNYPN